MSWSGRPPASTPVVLEVGQPGASARARSSAGLVSRVLSADDEDLVVAAPQGLLLDHDLTDLPVRVRWTDPYRGLCALPAVAEFIPADPPAPRWRLRIDGPAEVVQRRRYVREAVQGRVTVAPGWADPGIGITGWILDLSEGGVRALLPLSPGVVPGEDAGVVLDLVEGMTVTTGQALRVTRLTRSDQWEVVLGFAEDTADADHLRRVVFDEQRRRLGALVAPAGERRPHTLAEAGRVTATPPPTPRRLRAVPTSRD